MKNKSFIIMSMLSIIIVSGCTGPSSVVGPSCPTCPNPGTWSACTEDGMKTRDNYKCNEGTNYECKSYTEEKTCETELSVKGSKGMEVIISPTLDETVKGIIKVEAVKVPEGTESVIAFLYPQGVQLRSGMTEEELAQLIKEIDSSGADGWKIFFDTTKIENGLYQFAVTSTYEGAPEENPWLDYILTQVIVKN